MGPLDLINKTTGKIHLNQDWKNDWKKLEPVFKEFFDKKILQAENEFILSAQEQIEESELETSIVSLESNMQIYVSEVSESLLQAFKSISDDSKSKIVEAYNRFPAQFDAEKALIANQNWNLLFEANITTLEDALNPNVPTISTMRKYAPMHKISDCIEGIMLDSILNLNLKRNMTESQIRQAVSDFLNSSEFYYLNLTEVLYVVRQGRSGRWNEEGLFNAIGINDVFNWFRKYDIERTAFLEQKNHNEHFSDKNQGSKKSDWNKENLEKLLIIFNEKRLRIQEEKEKALEEEKQKPKKHFGQNKISQLGNDSSKYNFLTEEQFAREREEQALALHAIFQNDYTKDE